MAALTPNQIEAVFLDGKCSRCVFFSLKNVDAGDTVDVSPWFRVIKRGGIVSDSGTTIAAIAFTGTNITIPAGPVDDAVWLVIVGVSI